MSKTKKYNIPAPKIYMAQIWRGDLSSTRIFTNRDDAERAIVYTLKKAEAEGEYISDTAVCEMALEGAEFINTYSKRPEF